eukprot:gene3080-2062_t
MNYYTLKLCHNHHKQHVTHVQETYKLYAFTNKLNNLTPPHESTRVTSVKHRVNPHYNKTPTNQLPTKPISSESISTPYYPQIDKHKAHMQAYMCLKYPTKIMKVSLQAL